MSVKGGYLEVGGQGNGGDAVCQYGDAGKSVGGTLAADEDWVVAW